MKCNFVETRNTVLTEGNVLTTLRKPSVEFTYISVTFIHVLPPKWSGTVALRKKNVCYYIPAATWLFSSQTFLCIASNSFAWMFDVIQNQRGILQLFREMTKVLRWKSSYTCFSRFINSPALPSRHMSPSASSKPLDYHWLFLGPNTSRTSNSKLKFSNVGLHN